MPRTGPCCTTAGVAFGAGRRSLSPYWQEPCRSRAVWRSGPVPHDGPWSGIFGGRMSSPGIWPCCIRHGPRGCEKSRAVRRPEAATRKADGQQETVIFLPALPEGIRRPQRRSSRIMTDIKRPAPVLRATGLFCIFRGRPSCGGPAFYGRFFRRDVRLPCLLGRRSRKRFLWSLSGRRLARLRYIRSGDFLPKARFSGRRGPSLVFQKATSRASCPRARTRNSGGLRRPGPNRAPSRPARRQSPRRRAAARPAKARAWAGWRTAGAS